MRVIAYVAALVFTCAATSPAWAHAFPDNSSPHVGGTVDSSPPRVKVWFNGEIEPVFSTLIVTDAAGGAVSESKGKVDASDHTLLETAIPKTLQPGAYTVHWSVVAHDGHHTEGHFTFTVK